MTRTNEIEQLLEQAPQSAMPQLVEYLRDLVKTKNKFDENVEAINGQTPIADRSFGLIPASPELVKEILAEDFYEID